MKNGIDIAMERIADDLLALSALVLEDDTVSANRKTLENTLRDSQLRDDLFATVSQTTGDDPVVSAFFNNYVVFLEWNRPPKYGYPPPIDVLVDWAAKRGIPTDNDTLYAIRHAIWRDGHEGRPIFATIARESERLFEQEWGPWLFEAIIEDLTKYFNT